MLTTFRDGILSNSSVENVDYSGLQPCSHDIASDAFRHGFTDVMIQATDTDVVVLAVAAVSVVPGCKLWVAFGNSKSFRYIPAHSIATRLGPDASWGLLFLHAVSGCDTVSSFSGVDK